jgi:hypothetical protein
MDFSFAGEWSDADGDSMKTWLADAWNKIDPEEPEQDFLEYIMVSVR